MPIRNTLTDLHNMLMGQMERLDDEDLTDEELEREQLRTNSMCKIGKIICENAANMIEAQKLAYDAGERFTPQRVLIGNNEEDEEC